MALVTCPDCRREVSDRAPNCLGCGYPVADILAGVGVAPEACPDCGHEAGRGASICPGCGYPFTGTSAIGKAKALGASIAPAWKRLRMVFNVVLGGFILLSFYAAITLPDWVRARRTAETTEKTPSAERASQGEPGQADESKQGQEKPLHVESASFKIVDKSPYFWKVAYKIDVVNNGPDDVSGNINVKFLDKSGFPVDEDIKWGQTIRRWGTTSITGINMVTPAVGMKINSINIE